jgi:hypothetical protein
MNRLEPSLGTAKRTFLAFGLALCITGCGGSAPPPSSATAAQDYTGPVLDTRSIQKQFLWQQEITAHYGPMTQSFNAVVQNADGVLTVLGLTPFNTRAFSIEQSGVTFKFHNFIGRKLPFEPKNILIDIHRTFFVGVPSAPKPDGEHEHIALGERRLDTWRNGKLTWRTYERLAEPGRKIEINYGTGYAPGTPPERATFSNGWYGYVLDVTTTGVTDL